LHENFNFELTSVVIHIASDEVAKKVAAAGRRDDIDSVSTVPGILRERLTPKR
jgi:hypothetical protein